jgi:hypothetical protein
MRNSGDIGPCPVCGQEHFRHQTETIDFSQWTDRGVVRCKAIVTTAICECCRYKTWGGDAEAALAEAVRREYEKLPKRPAGAV